MTEPRARIDPRTVDEVREKTSIVRLVSRRVKLARSGRGWKGLCPFHQEKTPSFTVTDDKHLQFYHCFGCGAHGDCFKWVTEVDGVGFRQAVILLASEAGVTVTLDAGEKPHDSAALDGRKGSAVAMLPAHEARPSDIVSSTTAGRWIWQNSWPARGEIVEGWLESRGLNPFAIFDGANFAIAGLRFHARCPVSCWRVWEHAEDSRLTAPAMVAPIRDAEGLVRGVHVTFLSHDGRAKAKLPLAGGKERPDRKVFGKVSRCAIWLTNPALAVDTSLPLVVAEGIETAWSYAERHLTRPVRLAAAVSLENMQGGPLKLRDGSLPLWNVRADPDRPPFLLPDEREVLIAVDSDMKPLRGQKLQMARGERPVRADLSGLQRAEICAALAVQHWRRAGAAKVSAVRPRMGSDFNDAWGASPQKSDPRAKPEVGSSFSTSARAA